MTEPKHSPGPWSAIEEDGKWLVVCDAYEDETPGICGDHSFSWPLFEEDARIISAAPDMLGALKEGAQCLEDIATGKGGWAWEEVLENMRAAITKAQP